MAEVPLAPPEVAALLRAAMTTLTAELGALPERLAAWHPAPGEWCVKEIVGHLIEAERRGFAGRIRILLAESDPALQTWDQNEVARARGDCARPLAALLDELAALRRDSATLVAGLAGADLGRGGRHPKVGALRVGDLLQEWIHHDRNHIKQAMANVQAFVWPAMGNSQKFSG
ncbi:MAG: DinB family protein [Candidatus Rokuibacteriota bacterium]|nr:MAG: DinB family protein [Candidatus Rokubacteria bacterium]